MKNKDLWKSTFYDNETNKLKFEGDLSKLKDLNIKIKEILYFYNYLIDNNDEGFEEEEVKAYIRGKEEEVNEESEESEESEDSEDSEDSEYSDDSIKNKNVKKNVKNTVKVEEVKPSDNVKKHKDDDDDD